MDKKVAFFRTHDEVRKPDSDHVMKKNNNYPVHFAPLPHQQG
jgi:RpiR family carbohydrate utilization transcriptional regulator